MGNKKKSHKNSNFIIGAGQKLETVVEEEKKEQQMNHNHHYHEQKEGIEVDLESGTAFDDSYVNTHVTTPLLESRSRERSFSSIKPLPIIQEEIFNPYHRREIKRRRQVSCLTLEKCLSNLGVISELEIGDKLDFSFTGDFIIQKPSWYNSINRMVKGVDRWKTLDYLTQLFGTAEALVDEGHMDDLRVRESLVNAMLGLKNLQRTYEDDSTLRNKLRVLIQRVELRYDIESDAFFAIGQELSTPTRNITQED